MVRWRVRIGLGWPVVLARQVMRGVEFVRRVTVVPSFQPAFGATASVMTSIRERAAFPTDHGLHVVPPSYWLSPAAKEVVRDLIPGLAGHGGFVAEKVEVFAYYCGPPATDALNARTRAAVEHYTDIRGMTDDQAARRIADDEIDIPDFLRED